MRHLRLLSVLALSALGCSGNVEPITTFAGFCDAVLTPPNPNRMTSTARYFAADSIRSDFVRWYDSLTVSAIAYDFLGGAAATDTVPQELHRLQLIGVWRVGTTLHVANTLLYDADPSVPVEATFDGFVAEFARLASLDPRPAMEDVQECIFAAVNGFFSSVEISAGRMRQVSIPVAYYLKEHEQYDSVAAIRSLQ